MNFQINCLIQRCGEDSTGNTCKRPILSTGPRGAVSSEITCIDDPSEA